MVHGLTEVHHSTEDNVWALHRTHVTPPTFAIIIRRVVIEIPYIRQVERECLEERIQKALEIIMPQLSKSNESFVCQNFYHFVIELSRQYIKKFGRRYVNFNSIAGVLACVIRELKRIAKKVLEPGELLVRNNELPVCLNFSCRSNETAKKIEQIVFDLMRSVEHVGQLNYIISVICHNILLLQPNLLVMSLCDIIACASDFIYNVYAAQYENEKIKENGTISAWDYTIWEISKQAEDSI